MGMLVRPDIHKAPPSCRGKVRYRSKRAAEAGIARLRQRIQDGTTRITKKDASGRPLEVYTCGICGGWHFGHRPYTPQEIYDEKLAKRTRSGTSGSAGKH
jgi:hypothetical protein